ncbi:MAG: TolC family protein [Candidatus Omnitrophota bacterium]
MKKRKQILFGLIAFLFFSSSCCAYAQEVLDWKDCVQEALEYHPDLKSAQEDISQAKSDKGVALSAALPDISTGLVAKEVKSTTSKKTDSYKYTITGEQLLFDGFKTVADVKFASKTINAQEYNYIVVSSNIRFDLRSAFAGLLRAQELIGLTEQIAQRRKQNLELVELRYSAGREHKGALFQAQADLANAEFDVVQAKRNLSLAQRQLLKELGRSHAVPVEVNGTFDITEADEQKPDFEFLAESTPFLRELIEKKEALRLGFISARADFFPKVYFNGSFGETESSWPPQKDEWSAGVSVSFPIFEGGSRLAKAAKAKSQWRQAQDSEKSGRDSVVVTLERTWNDFQDAIDNVSVQYKFLMAAEERAKIGRAQYASGLINFDDWIILEDNLVVAQKTYLNAQAEMLIAEASWIQAKGGMLEYV